MNLNINEGAMRTCGECGKAIEDADIVHDDKTCLRVQLDCALLQNVELREEVTRLRTAFNDDAKQIVELEDERDRYKVALEKIVEEYDKPSAMGWHGVQISKAALKVTERPKAEGGA